MTLYAIRPDSATGSLDDVEVVNESTHGWEFLEQAVTLWRLVDSVRADQIEAIMAQATSTGGHGGPRFPSKALPELVRLLTGVEEAIVTAGIVDSQWRVPADRLDELAKRVPAMDLETERTLQAKTNALAEVMINAFSIRNFLSNAVDAGCAVVLA